MSTESMISFSISSLFFSFIILLIAIVPFGVAVKSRKKIAVKVAMALTVTGFVAQLNYFIMRWAASGHAPVSNLNEFLTFFGIMLIGILYLLIRLMTRKKIAQLLQPFASKVNLTLMDEISYRSVVIGFPLFALGALFFAMIWAQIAWSRFWGWDPIEVWALITFLFYAAFLHLRIGREWTGEKTAWLAIIGFGTIIFNQIFVNLVIAGLHSYA